VKILDGHQPESLQEAIAALELILSDELRTRDWIRSAEEAWEAVEAVPSERKFTAFDRTREAWRSKLDSWVLHVFSEFFDVVRSQAPHMQDSPVDCAEQKVREFLQRRFREMTVTADDEMAFHLETAKAGTMLDFWVEHACSGTVSTVPEDQQRVPRWLVAEDVPATESPSTVAGHIFQELRLWFLKEIENSIVKAHLKANIAIAKAVSAPPPNQLSSEEPRYLFKRLGDTWEVRFETGSARTKNLRGMLYIAELLRQPDTDISVEELSALDSLARVATVRLTSKREKAAAEEEFEKDGLFIELRQGDADQLLDDTAIQNYKNRLREIRDELEEADRHKSLMSPERKEQLLEEQELIGHQLAGSMWKGDARKVGNDKIRVAVTKAILLALEKIEKQCPEAGEYLRTHITTGFRCTYHPDSGVNWSF
jgi:hypothetical protein